MVSTSHYSHITLRSRLPRNTRIYHSHPLTASPRCLPPACVLLYNVHTYPCAAEGLFVRGRPPCLAIDRSDINPPPTVSHTTPTLRSPPPTHQPIASLMLTFLPCHLSGRVYVPLASTFVSFTSSRLSRSLFALSLCSPFVLLEFSPE